MHICAAHTIENYTTDALQKGHFMKGVKYISRYIQYYSFVKIMTY